MILDTNFVIALEREGRRGKPDVADVSWRYGVIYRRLASVGQLIGTNDLWIAATAIHYGMPLVTNNQNEFARVEGLETLGF